MEPGKHPSDGHPSYLPSRTFATTVMDLVTHAKPGSISFADLEIGVKNLATGDVRTALLALIQNASGDLDRAQKNIEQWFDDTMERASGWYKRRTQVVIVCVAALLTVGTNADTVRIGRILWTNGTLRSLLVEKAKSRTEMSTTTSRVDYPDRNDPLHPVFKPSQDELSALKSLLGWSNENLCDWKAWPSRILGWFLSIVAISLGAPFWFDTLKKIMSIRNAGNKPDKSGDKPAADPNPKLNPAPNTSSVAQ